MATRSVDVYLLPIPKKNLAAYKKLAQRFARIGKDHGMHVGSATVLVELTR